MDGKSFEIKNPQLVGKGAFGTVYRVEVESQDASIPKYMALKVMDREYEGLWKREAEALKTADHGLFPTFYEAGEDEGKFYILMEYVWGNPLSEVLDRRKGFSQPEAMRMAISVADGIAWLQQMKEEMVFRDLKAENLVLQPDGTLRLIDFGCACQLKDADDTKAGTMGACAPEQFVGDEKTGLYSDVYAFGTLFHYLLTGQNPAANLAKAPEPIRCMDPSLSAAVELLIEDCIRPVQEERIPDMLAVLKRLMDIATCSPRAYKKLEKEAEKKLQNRPLLGDVVYQKNIKK